MSILLITLTLFLFLLSIWSILLAKSNVTVILLSIESMLLCINFMFILASLVLDDLFGIVLFFFLLCLAGAEASLGSSIPIVVYRLRGLISVDSLCYSKG